MSEMNRKEKKREKIDGLPKIVIDTGPPSLLLADCMMLNSNSDRSAL